MNKLDDKNFSLVAKILIDSLAALLDQETDIDVNSIVIEFNNTDVKYNASDLLSIFYDQAAIRIDDKETTDKMKAEVKQDDDGNIKFPSRFS